MRKKNLTAEALMILRMLQALVKSSAKPPHDMWRVLAHLTHTYRVADLDAAILGIRAEELKE